MAKSTNEPIVEPDYVDGKWFKYCECGCGVYFEVNAKNRGQTRYTKQCGKRIHMENNYRKVDVNTKLCLHCHERKTIDYFPQSQKRDSHMSMCFDCAPFTPERSKDYQLPNCGQYNGDNDFSMGATCPLFENCRERLSSGWFLPCCVPVRTEVVKYVMSPKSERDRLDNLLRPHLDFKGQVYQKEFESYVMHYWDDSVTELPVDIAPELNGLALKKLSRKKVYRNL
jgi:hypothetical protein